MIDAVTAEEINKLFFEVIIAPGYEPAALDIFYQKKNRIVLVQKKAPEATIQFRFLAQRRVDAEKDLHQEKAEELKQITEKAVTPEEIEDLLFANKIVKHSKSNAIVLLRENNFMPAA